MQSGDDFWNKRLKRCRHADTSHSTGVRIFFFLHLRGDGRLIITASFLKYINAKNSPRLREGALNHSPPLRPCLLVIVPGERLQKLPIRPCADGTRGKFASFFYENGRKRWVYRSLPSRLSFIARWWLTLPYVWFSFSVDWLKTSERRGLYRSERVPRLRSP